jgi:hypothetical protein
VQGLRRAGGAARKLPRAVAVLVTFHFVVLGWVFFRAPTVSKAMDVLAAVFRGGGWDGASTVLGANAFVALLVAIFFLVHRFDDHRRVKVAVRRLRPEILWPIILVLWVLAITVSQGSSAKFIYFDF